MTTPAPKPSVRVIEELRALASHWESTAADLYAASKKECNPETAHTQRIMKAVYLNLASELRSALDATGGGHG